MSSDPDPRLLADAAALVLDHALARPASLGPARLVCLDGPAGSGKTTLADAVVAAARRRVASVSLLHLDDLYEGWSGLGPALTARIDTDILRPLSRGETGRYRRWDWAADDWAEEHRVEPVALLVLEGVGAAATAYDALVTTRVWVDAPHELRRQRGLDRGDYGDPTEWLGWLDAERAWLDAERTRDRADVIVDGTGSAPARLG